MSARRRRPGCETASRHDHENQGSCRHGGRQTSVAGSPSFGLRGSGVAASAQTSVGESVRVEVDEAVAKRNERCLEP
jgi:hypothetical protein